jgi:hypothetical protein
LRFARFGQLAHGFAHWLCPFHGGQGSAVAQTRVSILLKCRALTRPSLRTRQSGRRRREPQSCCYPLCRHSGESRNPALVLVSILTSAKLSLALRASELPFFACAKKGNRKKHTPSSAPSGHPALQVREGATGFAECTSMCMQRTGAHPAHHPSDFSSAPSPRHRGPVSAASCRRSSRWHFFHYAKFV